MVKPIITSLLDTDFYKFTMQQAIFHHYPNTQIEAKFHCRSNVDLSWLIDDVRLQIDSLSNLKLSDDEASWLSQLGIFAPDYLEWLGQFRLQPETVNVGITNGQLSISVKGGWLETTLFEIYILAIISELHGEKSQSKNVIEQGQSRLNDKLVDLKKHSISGFCFSDFGTRRRHSKVWHKQLLQTIQYQMPEVLAGTSNMWLAKSLNLPVTGTMGHEWLQAHQALAGDLADSQKQALKIWLQEYPRKLGIALTDTISMKAFLSDFDLELAEAFQGLRQDSGDPIWWGELALSHFESLGIDAISKTFVFSDSLNFEKALAIYQHFCGQVNIQFGIGTWLTNDVGQQALNMVLKMVKCNGKPVAKISDAQGKTLSKDIEYLKRLKSAFDL
ncbi:nicotinate phosphoribosyltransferase [Parashewanella curva]|uniref:Nicotinate phosphoribosyltransferase n=1 Tax=Parashewanella curva TaxID=2338552 RepID=A0A3L8Q288_9GAMM|nr:nicotinate phosphoribosyltransferase [Parashewanella curva]